MLQLLADFFVAALTAIALENVVFARGLGPFHLGESAPQDLVVFGALVTGITTLSSVLCWAVDTLLKPFGLPLYVRSIAFLLCICILYFGIYAGLAKKAPGLLAQYQGELSRAAFNSAAFGALLVAASERYSLGGWIGFGLGSGIGYTGALLLLYIAQEQFQMMDIPKVFRGLPILLVYIGIISLSIYGLIGHQLPA